MIDTLTDTPILRHTVCLLKRDQNNIFVNVYDGAKNLNKGWMLNVKLKV